jgi:hypothetical protein
MAGLNAYFAYFTPFLPMSDMRPGPDLNRLYAALFVSWLLHMMVLFASLLFAHSHEADPASMEVTNVLHARLSSANGGEVNSPDRRRDEKNVTRPFPSTEKTEAFFPANQHTRRPRAKGEVDLDIPEADMLTTSGTVVLKLWIDNLGKVVSVEIENTNLPEEFASAVAVAFGAVRFEPGEIYGRPVGSILRIEVSHENSPPSSP